MLKSRARNPAALDKHIAQRAPKQTALFNPSDTGRNGLKQIDKKLSRLEPHAHEGGRQPKRKRAPPFSPQPTLIGAKQKVPCIYNKNYPRLRQSGFRLGTPAECVSKGFGSALHQKLAPEKTAAFIEQFSTPYEKIINFDEVLWYKNGPPPPGKYRATLPMCFQKGFGAGSAALARKLKERENATQQGRQASAE